jgi:stage II sporulation protein D
MGDIYFEFLGDYENALVVYKKLLRAFPDDEGTPYVYHNIAKAHYRKGERKQAIQYYRELLSMFPDYYRDHNLSSELSALEAGGKLLDDVTMSVDRALPDHIRILLYDGKGPVAVSCESGMGVYSRKSSFFKRISTGRALRVQPRGNMLYFEGIGELESPVRLKSITPDSMNLNSEAYRGFFFIYARNHNLIIVNHVDLDEYLYGVLPREVSPLWPEHALQAQAIAARTYALFHMVKREKEIYDVFSTTSSQVYGGKGAEALKTKTAVDLSHGLVLTHENRIALTLYHANSGGQTEGAYDVWGSTFPYLSGVKDEFSVLQPGYSWTHSFSSEDLQERMKMFGLPVNSIVDIIPKERTESGRIKKLQIFQKRDSFYLTGNSFRLIVGASKIKSTHFNITHKDNNFIFEGNGYGHGVGMSQWGAYHMAKKGNDFKKILKFYYPGTVVSKIDS